MMSAIGALLLADADRLVRTASVAAAMSVEALLGTDVAFAAAYQLARPHPGQIAVAGGAPPPAARQRPAAEPPRARPQGPGPVLAALRPAGPRRGPRRAGSPAPGPRHRAELRHRQPAGLPGRRRRRPGSARDRRRRVISGGNFHGEPIALALDFAKLALAELGSISERRTALLVDAAAQRRAAAVPGGLVRHRLGDDDLPVHGGRPRVGEQGAGPSGVGRFDPDQRQPGGPRVDGLDRGAPRAGGARARRAHRRRSSCWWPRRRSTCAWQAPTAPRPGAGVAEALARVRARVRHLDGDREPGPDLAAATAIVHDGVLVDLVRMRRAGRRSASGRRHPARSGGGADGRHAVPDRLAAIRSISSR